MKKTEAQLLREFLDKEKDKPLKLKPYEAQYLQHYLHPAGKIK